MNLFLKSDDVGIALHSKHIWLCSSHY